MRFNPAAPLFMGLLLASHAFAAPYLVDAAGRPLGAVERTICGDNNMVKMIDQDEAMQKMGTPIGFYRAEMGGGTAMCSGTLVSKDLFLTARHCYESSCSGISVTFGRLERGEQQETFKCAEIVEKGTEANDDDYMLVRLEGNPGAAWGYYPLSDQELSPSDELLMIHHPGGRPMTVSRDECFFVGQVDGMVHHRCDTEGGSSGSGILVPDFDHPENTRVIGVHTLGGCNSDSSSSNSGPAIRHLIEKSALLKSLLK